MKTENWSPFKVIFLHFLILACEEFSQYALKHLRASTVVSTIFSCANNEFYISCIINLTQSTKTQYYFNYCVSPNKTNNKYTSIFIASRPTSHC